MIGPRPLVPEYGSRFNKRHAKRNAVRPGLECPPHDMSVGVRSWQDQLDNDVWYVENVSFATDVKLLANLIRLTFDKESARQRSSATKGIFMGYSAEGKAITLDDVDERYLAFVEEERMRDER